MRFYNVLIVAVAMVGACAAGTSGADAPANAANTKAAPETEPTATSNLTGITFDPAAQRYLQAQVLANCTAFLAEGGRQTFQGTAVSDVELLGWSNVVRPDAVAAMQKLVADRFAKNGYTYTVIGTQTDPAQTLTFFIAESNKPERIIGEWQATPAALFLGWGRLPASPRVEPAPPQPGTHVQGWIAATSIGFRGGLVCTYYWFRPDGCVYFGNPNGASTDANFAALQKSEPANCGTYGIVGGEMTLQRNGGKPQKLNYGGGLLGDGVVRGIIYFTPGRKLEGTWETSMSGMAGRLNIAASSSWVFRADGTFDNGSVAIVGNRHGDTGKADSNQGTYEFIGHRIRLKFADGTVKTVDVFGTAEKGKPYILGIDGNTYHNVK